MAPSTTETTCSGTTAASVAPATRACGSSLPTVCAPSRWPKGFAEPFRRRVLHFTPSWFAVNMGTGITALILYNLPYQFSGVRILATIVFVLNVVLFFTFVAVSALRYAVWPTIFGLMLLEPVQSLFLGTFAMGMSTIGSGVVYICVPSFGERWIYVAWVWWWMNVVVSLLIGIGIPFLLFTKHKNNGLASVTGVWLLPVVGPIVTAAAGGIVAEVLPPYHARLTLVLSYMMLGTSFLPALLILAIYVQRLAVHKLPPPQVIVSSFLPIGMCGQSAFFLLQAAAVLRKLQRETGVGLGGGSVFDPLQQEMMTAAISGISMISALVLTGFGWFWLIIAVGSIVQMQMRGTLPFNMGWWGFTFPIGTMATATTLLSRELDSTALRVVAMMLSTAVIFLWLFILVRTVVAAFVGNIFIAPCLGASGEPPVKVKVVESEKCPA